jgi:hypothetical protein
MRAKAGIQRRQHFFCHPGPPLFAGVTICSGGAIIEWRIVTGRREAGVLGSCGGFDDQRVDDGEALALGMDDDRVEVDFLDLVGVVGGEM